MESRYNSWFSRDLNWEMYTILALNGHNFSCRWDLTKNGHELRSDFFDHYRWDLMNRNLIYIRNGDHLMSDLMRYQIEKGVVLNWDQGPVINSTWPIFFRNSFYNFKIFLLRRMSSTICNRVPNFSRRFSIETKRVTKLQIVLRPYLPEKK